MLHYFLVLSSLVATIFAENAKDFDGMRLEFVQTLWRHGDRAALDELYPIFESNWTFGGGGLGELTPLGMSQMNDLGTMFRRIYVEEQQFLSHRYVGKEIYIRSTNVNRTIISAMSLLYGLFPPGAWNIQVNSSTVDGIDIAHETQVIQSGALLNELFDRAQEKANCIKAGRNCTGFLKPLKFYGYSSHDLVIYALLVSLGVPDVVRTLDGWPDTGAALTLEMYSNPDDQFFVKFLYRDNSLEEFGDVTARVCNRAAWCRLEDFERVARRVKPLPDLVTLCATPLSGSSSGSLLSYWISFFNLFLFLILVF
ncbi:hypothetical protein CAEBREN_20465 [Caenorhabditis brenneri]|uniref:Uncharacterized protein n=1 Tax=Caenorhabditis brenneri TaxID=135651 RepID=G0NNX7_CAEBE|nr:hypothetical protein CAEBREN_20465 [Caenorhabditis brenneri]